MLFTTIVFEMIKTRLLPTSPLIHIIFSKADLLIQEKKNMGNVPAQRRTHNREENTSLDSSNAAGEMLHIINRSH